MHSTFWRLTHGLSGLVLGYLTVLIPMYIALVRKRAPGPKLILAPFVAILSLIVAGIAVAMIGAVLAAAGLPRGSYFQAGLGCLITIAVGYFSSFAMLGLSNPTVSHRRGSVVTSQPEMGATATPCLSLAGVPIARQDE